VQSFSASLRYAQWRQSKTYLGCARGSTGLSNVLMLRSSGVSVTAWAATLRSGRRAWNLTTGPSDLQVRAEGVAKGCDVLPQRLDALALVFCAPLQGEVCIVETEEKYTAVSQMQRTRVNKGILHLYTTLSRYLLFVSVKLLHQIVRERIMCGSVYGHCAESKGFRRVPFSRYFPSTKSKSRYDSCADDLPVLHIL
jgi:hypothetical protein